MPVMTTVSEFCQLMQANQLHRGAIGGTNTAPSQVVDQNRDITADKALPKITPNEKISLAYVPGPPPAKKVKRMSVPAPQEVEEVEEEGGLLLQMAIERGVMETAVKALECEVKKRILLGLPPITEKEAGANSFVRRWRAAELDVGRKMGKKGMPPRAARKKKTTPTPTTVADEGNSKKGEDGEEQGMLIPQEH